MPGSAQGSCKAGVGTPPSPSPALANAVESEYQWTLFANTDPPSAGVALSSGSARAPTVTQLRPPLHSTVPNPFWSDFCSASPLFPFSGALCVLMRPSTAHITVHLSCAHTHPAAWHQLLCVQVTDASIFMFISVTLSTLALLYIQPFLHMLNTPNSLTCSPHASLIEPATPTRLPRHSLVSDSANPDYVSDPLPRHRGIIVALDSSEP